MIGFGSGFHQPDQIAVRVKAVLQCGLDHAKDDRASRCASRCIGKQEILSVDDEGLNAVLSPVVAQLRSAVLQIVRQICYQICRLP